MGWVLETLVYTACAIDCEGSIYLSKRKEPHCKKGYGYRLKVEVDNTNEILVRFLQDNFGGWAFPRLRKDKPNHKIVHQWIIDGRDASNLLTMLLPYLLLKRHQAELAIAFQNKRKQGIALTEREAIQDDEDYEAMKVLNKRGVSCLG